MKPGKPLTFATISCGPKASGRSGDAAAAPRQLLVFGLPGNPVSSLVTFTLVVLPCLRKLAGWQVRAPCAAVYGARGSVTAWPPCLVISHRMSPDPSCQNIGTNLALICGADGSLWCRSRACGGCRRAPRGL